MSQVDELKTSLLEGRLLPFDKPLKWTSFDVVNKVRSLIRFRLGLKKIKIGHAGTLDPLATGLLIICTGRMTKTIDQYQALEKEYTGTFFIGQTTPSFDLETKPDRDFPTGHIRPDTLEKATSRFIGKQMQIPPIYSAKKIEGERAYEFARRGEHTELKAREINISRFEITRVELPEADFRVVCSKGTYIRSLARDFGEAIGSGAYLKKLRRERIGHINAEDAWKMEDFEQYIRNISK